MDGALTGNTTPGKLNNFMTDPSEHNLVVNQRLIFCFVS